MWPLPCAAVGLSEGHRVAVTGGGSGIGRTTCRATSPTWSSFLRSDLARFVTGQNLVVDGGMTLPGAGVDGVVDRVKALLAGANGPMAGSGG
jgi:NAD(P)-dependent dehydrogenase (short-subunit alcohol dehydrogenase family)